MPKSSSKFTMIMLALCLATIAIYARTASCPFFIIDDDDYVVRNIHILPGLSFAAVKWAFTACYAANWHPLTWLSLLVDSQLFGLNPSGYHLVNVALHTANSALLFLLFHKMTGALWRSALVAALFALHPLHVESVAWIAERKDVLSCLFLMLTLLSYTSYVRHGKRSRYLLSIVLFALGLMAKPMLVTLPVVLLLLDFWPFARTPLSAGRDALGEPAVVARGECRLKALVVEKIPFMVLAAASSAVTAYAQSHGGAVATLNRLPVSVRAANAFWAYLAYARKTAFPYDLAVYYPLAPLPLWQLYYAVAVLCAVAALTIRLVRTHPYLAFGYSWYLITLLPVIGFVQVGGQAIADRYTYIPSIGLFVMLAWGGADLADKLPRLRKSMIAAAGTAVVACALLTWLQAGYWQSNEAIFSHTLQVTKDNFYAHNGLGRAYEQQGKTNLAIFQYKEALRIVPNDPEFLTHLGNALDNQGKTLQAIEAYEEALKGNPRLADGHYNLGLSLVKLGRLNEAVDQYRDALKWKPESPLIQIDLGNVLDDLGRTAEAIGQYEEALRLSPDLAQGHYNLAVALQRQGRFAEAAPHVEEAFRLDPGLKKGRQPNNPQ